jgi:SAM-dependent methyltransferase
MILRVNTRNCPAFLDLYRAAGGGRFGWTLDLGIGDGRLMPGTLELGERWLGYDLRRTALLRARAASLLGPHQVAFHQGNAERLPYRTGSFSSVVSNGLLHHVSAPDRVLMEAERVLAPGGLVLFRGPVVTRPGRGGRLLELADLERMVSQLGYTADTVQRVGRHWLWCARKQCDGTPIT